MRPRRGPSDRPSPGRLGFRPESVTQDGVWAVCACWGCTGDSHQGGARGSHHTSRGRGPGWFVSFSPMTGDDRGFPSLGPTGPGRPQREQGLERAAARVGAGGRQGPARVPSTGRAAAGQPCSASVCSSVSWGAGQPLGSAGWEGPKGQGTGTRSGGRGVDKSPMNKELLLRTSP